MKLLKHWTFIVLTAIGTLVYILQRLKIALPLLINNYLNDILSIPITLFIILAIIRTINSKFHQLSIGMIFAVVLYFSLYFECFLPKHNVRYTTDYWDILCYFIGGVLFYMIQFYVLNEKIKDNRFSSFFNR